MAERKKYRTHVYVDGFNLYYGALKGTAHRWLDLQAYFERLLQHDDVRTVRYFTAHMLGDPSRRQMIYLRALAAQPKIQIHLGLFKRKSVACGVRKCNFGGDRFFVRPEEKRTDVNIAVWMLRDALSTQVDRIVLASGDSDLVPAIEAVRTICPDIDTRVYVPSKLYEERQARELSSAAHWSKQLPSAELKKAHLPDPVTLRDGTELFKPRKW